MTHERRYGIERGAGLTWLTCEPCQKRGYPRKADAKAAARRLKGRGAVYRCPAAPDDTVYHVGHLPPAVRAGKLPRAALRGLR